MSIESLVEFQERITAMTNPRERRAFLDSFYARLRQSDLSAAQVAEVGRASELLRRYGFEPHSRKLMVQAGTAFLSFMNLGRFGEEDMYGALPYVNRIGDQMESAGMVQEADELIDYFALQVVLMTLEQSRPKKLPLSEPMAKAKALTLHVSEGYRQKSRFVVLPEDGSNVPGEFELEGKKVCAGYTRDGIMLIGTKGAEEWPNGPRTLEQAPPGVPDSVTYERLRNFPMRGIMLVTYSLPNSQ